MVDGNLKDYYARRAPEYERIYELPERQQELAWLKRELPEFLAGRNLLEIACGTGYWTRIAATTAKSIRATDVNQEVLAIARTKDYGGCDVSFAQADAFDLKPAQGEFDGAMVAFWWSHMLRQRTGEFMRGLEKCLKRGARIVIVDNAFAAGSSSPVTRIDDQGNKYQTRTLADGSTFEVLKNFPDREQIEAALPSAARVFRYRKLTYYWYLVCDLADGG